ncbi:MAG TPA: TonB-dependent receptor [Bryobacteraceae bacterium]|nr:TonB-dependent receptor [Bryobacteraceae bacterium]
MKDASRVVCILAGLLAAMQLSWGQAVNGTLLGTVTDATGATVPAAKVTITEQNTGVSRSAETTQAGYYAFPDLPPGTYTVHVELTGFKKYVRQNVDVLVNTTIRVDAQLQPGEVTESIQVTAEAPLLQTDRSDTGRKIETQQIVNMPLGFNRNFQGLLNLVPGTTRAFRPHSVFFNAQDSLSTQVNGQSRMANNVQLEGIDNNHRTGLLTAIIPPIEALQTVDITTSNYEASLGRAGGAVTNVILRSGTNDLHGSAYWFNRVSRFGARSFFATSKPVTVYNYMGGTVGGPIIRNKMFFFGDYLRINDYRGQSFRFTLPTMDIRNGNLSSSTTPIYDPRTGDATGAGRTQFTGNIIPADRISPIARRILALVPAPNLPGTSNNFSINTTLRRETDSFDTKVDHNWTDSDRFSARWSFQRPVTTDPPAFGLAGGPIGGGFQGTGIQKAHNAAINYNHIFSPTLITEVRGGVNRYRNDARSADYGTKATEQLGIPGVNLDDWSSGMVQIDVGGYSNPLIGYSASLPWIRSETNFNVVNTWTKTWGSHTSKFGGDIRRLRDELLQTQTFNPRGRYQFRENTTGCRTNCSGVSTTSFYNSFASFLLDIPTQAGRDLAIFFPAWRQWQYFLFAHDKWQVTPKLTVDLGLRWEFYRPATPRFAGGFSNYDWENNTLILAGIGNNPMDLGMRRNYKNFAPRVGIAYRLTDKTVLRTGFGVSYIPYADNRYAYNFPIRQNQGFNALNAYTPAIFPSSQPATMAAGFPAPQPAVIPSSGIIRANATEQYDTVNLDFKEGYVQSWNLALQRGLPWNMTFEAAYVGNKGTNIPTQFNVNAGQVIGAGAAGRPYFARFGRNVDTNINFIGSDSNYHSLQVKFDKRYSQGVLWTTAYTWSRAMAEANDDNGGLTFYIQPQRNYARAGFDRRHTFVQSYIWDLPFGRGRKWLSSGPAAFIIGGWQLNGILTLMSGRPFHVTSNVPLEAPGTTNTVDVVGPIVITGRINDAPWIDPSAFRDPPRATATTPARPGNLGRNSIDGPGFFNLDASLFKNFEFTERWKLELRAEAFSVTNTPQWSQPNTGFGNQNTFGRITGVEGGNRQVQLGAKLVF